MRLPSMRELTKEQKNVYLYAPNDKHVLVHGPPGTGKTLIACLRAIELQKRGLPVALGMFNRVLTKYSSNVGDGQAMPTNTLHGWFRDWWHRSGLPPHASAGRLVLQVDFEEKEEAKAAGARWHKEIWQPWGRKPGVWAVDFDVFSADPSRFERWRIWHQPPCVDGNESKVDWTAVADHLLQHEERVPDDALELGTLLIDEGQDFPPALYRLLRTLAGLARAPGPKVAHPLRCFILADENQQITEDNSTLDQIAEALKIDPDNRYLLLDNFRNSKEIAELARRFFSDVGVLPKLPKRSTGDKPTYVRVRSTVEAVNRIVTWIRNNPDKEVGVLVFKDGKREVIFQQLQEAVRSIRGRDVTVQTYSWGSRTENPVKNLLFDESDVVTVLNMQSSKGLEFDAVFVVDLHEAPIGLYGPDRFRMQMFVGVSRARDWVELVDSGAVAGTGIYLNELPPEEYLAREDESQLRSSSTRRNNAESGQARHAHGDNGWEAALKQYVTARRLRVNDRRPEGGAVWVNGGPELENGLEPLGFKYSEKRNGWWRK